MVRKRISLGIAALMVALALAAPPARASLISERQEMQMGADAARQLEAKYPVSRDARKKAQVETMGRRLAAVSHRPNLAWQFRVLETREVNALSVPGYVYVNTGLIEFTGGDRHELAAVIAHEIAHTTRRHAVNQTEKAMVGSLALRFLFKDSNSLTRDLAGTAANLALLGYGRHDEFEADRFGVEYLIRAGYDPKGMIRFFEKLRAREGREVSGLATYFQSHPPTSERIRKVQEYLATRGQQRSAPPAARAGAKR